VTAGGWQLAVGPGVVDREDRQSGYQQQDYGHSYLLPT
jgi:hypothetical protein